MGLAELIPGISGATIALLFGIYKNLIYILSNIKLSKKIFSKEYFVNDLQISLMVFLCRGSSIAVSDYSRCLFSINASAIFELAVIGHHLSRSQWLCHD